MPRFLKPCDPTLRERPPVGDDWLYEIKADGYRAQVHLRDGDVTVYSRSGFDWTDQFGVIAQAAKTLPARQAVIDGEAVVYGLNGVPDFQALRRELGRARSGRLIYHAFDLLHLDGYDLRGAPYVQRKRLLHDILAGAAETLHYVEYLDADGEAVFAHACRLGLEGVLAKRRDAPYRGGRQDTWIKLKCQKSDSFPIVAFVEKLGAKPRRIASLYVGRREEGRLLYAGKVRSGYSHATARELRETLDPLIVRGSPLSEPMKKPKATWVRPEVEAEVEYGGITDDGLLREAVFKGLREDLRPTSPPVKAPSISPPSRPRARPLGPEGQQASRVARENILQLLPDAVVPSQAELAAYWRKVAKRALVHLGGRPLKLVRHTRDTTFYHKGPLPPIAEGVHTLRIAKREGGEGVRVWVDDLTGLLGLVEMDVVEVHPWNARVDDIEHADRLVFDLDPGDGIAWPFVIDTAVALRDRLTREGLDAWPKTTGGKGLHVMVPLARKMTHDAAHACAGRLAGEIAARDPERYTVSATLARRPGRLFIDYLRNGRGTTAVGAFSPRVRPGFPIAAPVSWRQVERGIQPAAYTMTHPFRPA